jgi:hypothetical protein
LALKDIAVEKLHVFQESGAGESLLTVVTQGKVCALQKHMKIHKAHENRHNSFIFAVVMQHFSVPDNTSVPSSKRKVSDILLQKKQICEFGTGSQ